MKKNSIPSTFRTSNIPELCLLENADQKRQKIDIDNKGIKKSNIEIKDTKINFYATMLPSTQYTAS